MPVQDKPTLKGYFNDGDVPVESNYIDLIDTMGDGDMRKTDYDSNDDGIVDDADKVSEFGLGTTAKVATGDWNNYKTTGFFYGNALTNSPTGSFYYVVVIRYSDLWVSQEATYFYTIDTPRKYIRRCVDGTWDAWEPIHPAHWNYIEGKPSTYSPSAHTHPGGDITSAVANATNAANAADSDKLDGLHAASFHRVDQDIVNPGGAAFGFSFDPSNGEIAYDGPLRPKRDSSGTPYYAYPFVPITTFYLFDNTSSQWDWGTNRSTGTYTFNLDDANNNLPDEIFAVALQLTGDFASVGTNRVAYVRKAASVDTNNQLAIRCRSYWNGSANVMLSDDNAGVIAVNQSGGTTPTFQVQINGATLNNAELLCVGYFL